MTFRRSTCFGNNADGENLANFFKLWKAHSCHLRFFHSFFTHKVQDLHPHKEMGAAIYSLYRIASAPIHLLRILGKKKMKAYKKRRANAIAADEGCRENKEVHSRVMWAGPFFAYLWGHGTAHNERHTQIYHKVFFFSPPFFPQQIQYCAYTKEMKNSNNFCIYLMCNIFAGIKTNQVWGLLRAAGFSIKRYCWLDGFCTPLPATLCTSLYTSNHIHLQRATFAAQLRLRGQLHRGLAQRQKILRVSVKRGRRRLRDGELLQRPRLHQSLQRVARTHRHGSFPVRGLGRLQHQNLFENPRIDEARKTSVSRDFNIIMLRSRATEQKRPLLPTFSMRGAAVNRWFIRSRSSEGRGNRNISLRVQGKRQFIRAKKGEGFRQVGNFARIFDEVQIFLLSKCFNFPRKAYWSFSIPRERKLT